MKTKLTQEQISYLFSFCAEQGIIHYDVQIEMVDHFTEWIETNWEKHPSVSFMAMTAKLELAFPKAELIEIVIEKENMLKKQMFELYKVEYKSFFTLPKIALSILLFILFFILPWSDKKFFSDILYTSLMIINFYSALYHVFAGKNMVLINKEQIFKPVLIYEKLKWLMKSYNILMLFSFSLLLLFWILNKETNSNYYNSTIGFIIKSIIPFYIIGIISFVHVQVNVNKKIRELYPTAFANS